uniref:Osteoclast-stimulating factor 1 n=1 Tax=Sinocyclocheilus rhinocerous TaxID=307959 RepID=A0A673LRH2_9TELE
LEVLVLLDFEATMSDELTVHVGDVVKNVSKGKEEGWLEGELRGKRGMFPSNFAKEVPVYLIGDSNREPRSMRKLKKPKVQTRKCEVAFPYTSAHEDELELVVGETIEILREIEDGWWMGKKNNQIGAFPSNFVKEIFVPSKGDVGKVQQRPSLRRKTSSVKECCQVMFDYKAVAEDELNLKKGDVIAIINKSTEDEGWWEGELNGRRGFFPDNFVMVIPADALHVSVGQRNVLMIGPFVHLNQMPVMDQNSSDTNTKTETKRDKPDTKDLRSDPPGKIKLPGLHKPPVPPPPVKEKPIKLVPKNEEPQPVSPKQQPPASPVQKEGTEPQSSPSTKTEQVAKTTSPPKTPPESKAVAQEESTSLASVLTELKDIRMSLDLLKAQHERDIKELKDELKDETEKRTRLQDEVEALRKKQ